MTTRLSRRLFLQGSLVLSAGTLLGCSSSNSSSSGPGNLITGQPLYIPPLETGAIDSNGTRVFEINATQTQHAFFDAAQTDTWAFQTVTSAPTYLGPTLKLTDGESVSIRYTNQLDETITVHGHGMHVPGPADGGPHQTIAPGTTWAAEYTVKQPACTAWYHPHQMGKTAEQVYHGLAGLILVEDSTGLNLPSDYGVDDIPLILQDRRFDDTGQINYAPNQMEIMQGYKGDVWLTNGQVEPEVTVPRGWVRLRILNASNAGVYTLTLSDNTIPMYLIAADGGLLQAPVDLTGQSITLTPAERVEIMIDTTHFDPGTRLKLNGTLENSPPDTGGMGGSMTMPAVKTSGTWLTLKVGDTVNTATLPTTLSSYSLPTESDAVTTRTFTLGAQNGTLTINGNSMDMNRIDVSMPIDQWEVREVTNTMPLPHNFHVHAAHFIPLDRNGDPNSLRPWEKRAWKDTIYVPGNATVRFLVKMTDYTTDETAPYMFHCHFLEHEDTGMMGQFTVV